MHPNACDPIAKLLLDLRRVLNADRAEAILAAFRTLSVGDSMELVDDREATPVFLHLRTEAPGSFGWHCLEAGPRVWRIRISRLATWWADGQCCGSCQVTSG